MNLVWWQEAQKRLALENASLPKAALERLKCAGQTLGYLLLPDGTMPQIGDGNPGNGRQSLHHLRRQDANGRLRDRHALPFPPTVSGCPLSAGPRGKPRASTHPPRPP